jgi:hypothetical protein
MNIIRIVAYVKRRAAKPTRHRNRGRPRNKGNYSAYEKLLQDPAMRTYFVQVHNSGKAKGVARNELRLLIEFQANASESRAICPKTPKPVGGFRRISPRPHQGPPKKTALECPRLAMKKTDSETHYLSQPSPNARQLQYKRQSHSEAALGRPSQSWTRNRQTLSLVCSLDELRWHRHLKSNSPSHGT